MIEIITSGIGMSVQDLGRTGFRSYGVPISGAMDLKAAILANQILGNPLNSALLEFLVKGPQLKFNQEAEICITGGLFSPTLNGLSIPQRTKIHVNKGALLRIGNCKEGAHGYLSVKGGLDTPEVLDSKSFYAPIYNGFKLKKGMKLNYFKSTNLDTKTGAKIKRTKPEFNNSSISVLKGPEFNCLPIAIKKHLLHNSFKLSTQISRMGYQLEVDRQLIGTDEIITAPVQPGTVQLTPSGKLIILMRDGQTTGGYARVLQLTDKAINQLAQMRIGAAINFNLNKSL